MARPPLRSFVFFLNDTATTEIYTLSLHDALPIYSTNNWQLKKGASKRPNAVPAAICKDRKSTRLNSSHLGISYAVFGLKKKKSLGLLQIQARVEQRGIIMIRKLPVLVFFY